MIDRPAADTHDAPGETLGYYESALEIRNGRIFEYAFDAAAAQP